MRTICLFLILVLSGCTASPKAKKIDVEIRNVSCYPVGVTVEAGFFVKTIVLSPGMSFCGEVDPAWITDQRVRIVFK